VIVANAASALDVRHPGYRGGMTVLRSVLLFVLAALAEIGGAWLVWQGVREHRGVVFVGAGILALGLYGFVATFQPDPHFGRVLAAYGGVFVAGSLAWGVLVDGFRPDRYDPLGAALCPAGVTVIMDAPRAVGVLQQVLGVAAVPSHQDELSQQAVVGSVVELLEAPIGHGPVPSSAAPLDSCQETRHTPPTGSIGDSELGAA
jgi:small multidrug resistance family-3 protein